MSRVILQTLTSADIPRSVFGRQTSGYKALAWALISDALREYHAYHNEPLRGALVLRAGESARKKGFVERAKVMEYRENELRHAANRAERWIDGANARYPFWLAASWMGWEARILSERLKDGRTGWNLLVQQATTPANKDLPETERVFQFVL